MAYFYAWETVDLKIVLEDPDRLLNYDTVCVSVSQGYRLRNAVVNVEDLDIDTGSGTIVCHLDQEDTGLFRAGIALLQVNIYYDDGERDTSEQVQIDVRDNLLKEVMS